MKYTFLKEEHKIFPPMVQFEVTNACNLKCVHCYSSTLMQGKEYRKKFLNPDIFMKIVDFIRHNGFDTKIVITADGEPLLHPQIMDMLAYISSRKSIPITLITNGVLLTKERIDRIIGDNLLSIINISIDAFKKETYERIRGPFYDKLMDNLAYLIEKRNSCRSLLKIMVNFIADRGIVKNEIADFEKYWSLRVDKILKRTYNEGFAYGGVEKRKDKITGLNRWPCFFLWSRIIINYDADIKFCPNDWLTRSKVGNLAESSINEIWVGQRYEHIRRCHTEGKFHLVTYCKDCTEWRGTKWDYNFFTAIEGLIKDEKERGD